jgi:hypothetical protein
MFAVKTLYLDFEVLYQNETFIDNWIDILFGFMSEYYVIIGSNYFTRLQMKSIIKNNAGNEHWNNSTYKLGLESITYVGFGIDKFILKDRLLC